MAEESGFFRFDTNIDAVVSDVEGGLRRLNNAVSKPLRLNNADLGFNTQELQQTFSRAEAELVQGQQRIRELFSQRRGGLIDAKEFDRGIRSVLRDTVGGIPRLLTRELADVPATVAATTPAKGIAKLMAQDFVGTFNTELDRGLASAGGSVRSVERFHKLLEGLLPKIEANPLDLTPDQTLGYYSARVRAEKLIQDNLKYPAAIKAKADHLGLGPMVNHILEVEGRRLETESGGVTFEPSDAAQRLRELTQATNSAETIGRKENDTLSRQDREAREAALGVLALTEQWERLSRTRVRDPAGQVYKKTPFGYTEDLNIGNAADFEDDAAAQARRRADTARLEANFDQSIPITGAGGTYRRLGDEIYKITGDTAQLVTKNLELLRVYEAEAAALANARAQADRLQAADARREGRSGFLPGVQDRFHRGEGDFLYGLGNQFGSALGFSLAYGSLFALQGAMRDTLSEFLDYQDSVTDLEVATRGADVVTSHWVNSLSELSRVSGDNVGAAIDAAARGVRAFTTLHSSDAEIELAGTNTAKTATRLALIANKPLPDATGDIVASGSAFGLAPDQLEQVVDAVANAKRTVGGDAAQISQGLSLIALSSQEAGYNLNEAAAVIGLVQARTDQSGQAIATRLTRIFQIVQGSTGKRLASELGVDPTASVKQRIEAFAQIYSDEDTTEATRNRIASALGGTANLRELLPLLKENTALQEAYRQAIVNSGQGTDEYNRKTQNLVGTLKKIAADIKNVQVGLGKSGLFDFAGGGVKIFESALHGLNDLIAGYNELTDGHGKVKALLGTTVALGVALRGLGSLKAAGFFKGAASGLGDAGLPGGGLAGAGLTGAEVSAQRAALRAELALMEQRLVQEGRFNEALAVVEARRLTVEGEGVAAAGVGGAAGAGRLGKFGMGLGVAGRFLLNPWTLGIGAVVGALALYGVARTREEQKQNVLSISENSLQAFSRLDGTSAAFRAAAQDMNAAFGEIRKSPVPGTFESERDDLANAAKQRREVLVYLAHQAEYDERAAAAAHKVTIFGTGAIETVEQLADGLAIIGEQGGTGLDQWNMLVKGLTTPPPPVGTEFFTRRGLNNAIIGTLAHTARRSIPDGFTVDEGTPAPQAGSYISGAFVPSSQATYLPGGVSPTRVSDKGLILDRMPLVGYENGAIRTLLGMMGYDQASDSTGLDDYHGSFIRGRTAKQINRALNKAQDQMGLDPSQGVTDAQKEELLKRAMKVMDFSKLGKDAHEIVDAWYENALSVLKDSKVGSEPFGKGSPLNTLNGDGPLNRDQVMQLLNPDPGEDGVKPPGLQDYIDAALASVPANDDGTKLESVQKGIAKFLSHQVRRNRASGEDVHVLQLMQKNAWEAFKETQLANLEDLREAAESQATNNKELRAIRLKWAKIEFNKAGTHKNQIEALMESMDRQTIRAVLAYQREAIEITRAAIKHAQQLMREAAAILNSGVPNAGFTGLGGGYFDAFEDIKKLKGKFKRQKDFLKAWDDVFQNDATVTENQADGNFDSGKDKKDPKDLAAERKAKAEEHLNNAIDALQLTGDFTDPVEQARDALRAAKMRYAFEKTPGNLFDIRQSAAALEKAKWDQKLSDMQTAEQLGRISYATYVRFLQNESDRMHKMNHKTRQQIDHMNEIDLALKETTASMEGQFNLGDIDTKGFVYAVRRMMGGGAGGGAQGGGNFGGWPSAQQYINNNQHIEFHGISERNLRRVLADLLGGVPIHTTSSRKVA